MIVGAAAWAPLAIRSSSTPTARKAASRPLGLITYPSLEPLWFSLAHSRVGKRWLGEITDVTGGRTIAAGDLGKVPEIAATVSREMRSEYVLGYRPHNAKRDGKWRKIRVQVNPSPSAGRVQAYYKRGYLAGPR